ncbi:MAG: menaquinol oxidoreductase [Chloroflexi bacterium]|nr:menaquinol oxidoreductase [Chloroflexota bacterium]
MSDEKTRLPATTPETQAPERRTTLPAAPPERRTTEIDKQRVPMAAKPYRLLALVKQDAVVRVQKEPDDTVMTWPHLLSIEFFAAAMISVFLLLMGIFINAPLEELANPNVTPAVAKAPWYLVGLQELLAYFHPTVAGVLSIAYIVVGAAIVPFVDRGPRGDGGSPRPSDRKVGVLIFSMFAVSGLVITFLGAFFRGPGYAWTLPWQGLYFAL